MIYSKINRNEILVYKRKHQVYRIENKFLDLLHYENMHIGKEEALRKNY